MYTYAYRYMIISVRYSNYISIQIMYRLTLYDYPPTPGACWGSAPEKHCMTDRDRDRDRETDRERQIIGKDIQGQRKTGRQTETETDRQTDRQTDIEI